MRQDPNVGHEAGRASARARFVRAVAAAALLGLVAGTNAPARAADDSEAQASAWSKFMQSLGLKKPAEAAATGSNINYTERPPLVVPPSRDLPPPGTGLAVPPDWPKDPARPVKRAKVTPGVVPGTAVQTPNPPYEKKPWYNPAGWFDKEEYATFKGEPERQDLTDPPSGYRVPSPAEPYGISPDKKSGRATMANPNAQGTPTPQAAPTAPAPPNAPGVPNAAGTTTGAK
jgi:hypothetical protein